MSGGILAEDMVVTCTLPMLETWREADADEEGGYCALVSAGMDLVMPLLEMVPVAAVTEEEVEDVRGAMWAMVEEVTVRVVQLEEEEEGKWDSVVAMELMG